MTTLSNHVPDPRLVTAFAQHRDSPFHRVNPWTKVALTGAFVVTVTVADSLAVLAGSYAATLAVYGVAGLAYRRLAGWYTLPALFVVSVAGPLAFLEPGTAVGGSLSTPVGDLSVTWTGLTLFAELAFRSLTVVTFTLAAVATTRYAHVAAVLGRLLPRPVDQIALLTYRFTFVMIETLEDLLKAALSRGASLSEFWSNRRLYARLLGTTMLTAVERSERLVVSMEARGYDGTVTPSGDAGRPPARELVAVAVVYATVVAYALAVYGVVP
ncbi:energy-coupling factor transporter transmembrane protein EcfT [Halobaculum sp. MBLA0143]|uniref:energy-coupling factor transporter transmembrane component T family protein n=1 Tax=Halobaculum sp. MBLA0143 TaxID=3079933 RepID=UPI00352325C6